jgi:hypothetical protein
MSKKMIKYHRKCGDFSICCELGEAGVIHLEPSDERRTLFQIIVRGSGRMAKIFDSNYILGDSNKNNFIDMRKYMGYTTIFEADEPFFIYGFNTLDPEQDWDGKLISDSFEGTAGSILVCFKGNPIINGTTLKPRDYARLENKKYNVTSNDSIIGIFTKL